MVSRRYLCDVAEFWCANSMPTVLVTSAKCTAGPEAAVNDASNAQATTGARTCSLPRFPGADDAFGFLDDEESIDREIAEGFLEARRPRDLDALDSARGAQPEMEPKIVLRIVPRPAHDLVDLAPARGRHLHARPDRRSVRAGPRALDRDPVVAVPAVVAQQGRRAVEIVDEDVDVAVVVHVAERAATGDALGGDCRPRTGRHVFEPAVSQIAIERLGLAVRQVQFPVRDLRVHMSVGDEDIGPPVVVEVEEVHPEAQMLPIRAKSGPDARDLESRAIVAVERRHLFGEVRA